MKVVDPRTGEETVYELIDNNIYYRNKKLKLRYVGRGDGHLAVSFKRANPSRSSEYLHRIIWSTYNKTKIPENHHIHHVDGNKNNNHIKNLALISKSKHHSLHNHGVNNSQSTITEQQAEQILELWKQKVSRKETAQIVGCSERVVKRVRSNKNWKRINARYGD